MVHISDSPDSLDVGVYDIKQWHLERGFKDIGYHFVVRKNGNIEVGRDMFVKGHKGTLKFNPGAHVKGFNSNTIGICVVGRNKMTVAQKNSLLELIRGLIERCSLKHEHVVGHCELDANSGKTCPAPAVDMNMLRAELLFKEKINCNFENFKKGIDDLFKEFYEKDS